VGLVSNSTHKKLIHERFGFCVLFSMLCDRLSLTFVGHVPTRLCFEPLPIHVYRVTQLSCAMRALASYFGLELSSYIRSFAGTL
jgi:hypothetical protein